MADEDNGITDLTRGVYRKVYSGFLRGKRINNVSLEAEAWFWRLHAAADDFGNLDGDDQLLHAATCGRRRISQVQVTRLIDELVSEQLVSFYEHDGEKYLHIVGFMQRQPAGKNGKRIKRYPAPPDDAGPPPTRSDDGAGGIPVNPDESSASKAEEDEHDAEDENEDEHEGRARARSPTEAKAEADRESQFRSRAKCWLNANKADLSFKWRSLTNLALLLDSLERAVEESEPYFGNKTDPFAYAMGKIKGERSERKHPPPSQPRTTPRVRSRKYNDG